jgi:uncharacterized protein (DUF1810 family)
MPGDPFDLARFRDAQAGAYEGALAELAAGQKRGHWIWFVFPQLVGLGRSELSRFYGIRSIDEARAFLADPVLGSRLEACTAALLSTTGRTAEQILGSVDAAKVRSSMTLFRAAGPGIQAFDDVLTRFYDASPDPTTMAMLDLTDGGARDGSTAG